MYSLARLWSDFYYSDFYKRLSYNTQDKYSAAHDNLCKVLGVNKDISLIDRKSVNIYYKFVKSTRGQSAAALDMAILRRMFNIAMREWGWIDKNPFERLDIKRPPSRNIVWTQDELKKFVDKADKLGYKSVGLIAYFCYETMQRPIDIINLQWTDYISEQQVLEIVQKKTGTCLVIPISDKAAKILDNWYNDQDFAGLLMYLSPYIFGINAVTPWDQSNLNKVFNKIKEAAGLRKEIQLRDLRRTAATDAINAGVTEDELRAIGGWKSRQVISTYARANIQTARNAQQKRWSVNNDHNLC